MGYIPLAFFAYAGLVVFYWNITIKERKEAGITRRGIDWFGFWLTAPLVYLVVAFILILTGA